MILSNRQFVGGLLLFLSCLVFHSASMATPADGTAMIRLYGNLAADTPKRVSVKQIEAIGVESVEAYNPYEKRSDNYTGVWFDRFAQHFGATNVSKVTLKAIDDYQIEFEPSEWQQMRILIATRVNGDYIGYDKKGPMRIIFPDFDAKQEIYQVNLPKWMWMINKIEFN